MCTYVSELKDCAFFIDSDLPQADTKGGTIIDRKELDQVLINESPMLTEAQAKALMQFWEDSGLKVRAALIALQIPTFDMHANARASESYRHNLGKIAEDLKTVAAVLRAMPPVLEKMAERVELGISE